MQGYLKVFRTLLFRVFSHMVDRAASSPRFTSGEKGFLPWRFFWRKKSQWRHEMLYVVSWAWPYTSPWSRPSSLSTSPGKGYESDLPAFLLVHTYIQQSKFVWGSQRGSEHSIGSSLPFTTLIHSEAVGMLPHDNKSGFFLGICSWQRNYALVLSPEGVREWDNLMSQKYQKFMV